MRARGKRSRRAAAVEWRRASPQNRNRRTSGSSSWAKLLSARHRSANEGVDVHTSTPEERRSANRARRYLRLLARDGVQAAARGQRAHHLVFGQVEGVRRLVEEHPATLRYHGKRAHPRHEAGHVAGAHLDALRPAGGAGREDEVLRLLARHPAAPFGSAHRAGSRRDRAHIHDATGGHARTRSASGSGTVAAKSGAPSWDTMSMRRAAGISVSTGTNACPLFKAAQETGHHERCLVPQTTTGSRSISFARPAPRRWRPTASTTPRTPSSSRRPRGRQAPADATAPPPQPIAGIRSPLPSTTAPSLSSWLQPGCVPQAGGSKIGPDYGSAVTATDS